MLTCYQSGPLNACVFIKRPLRLFLSKYGYVNSRLSKDKTTAFSVNQVNAALWFHIKYHTVIK